MAEYTALAPLFTDIANAIRSKTGETGQITANNFPEQISNITSVLNILNGKVQTFTAEGNISKNNFVYGKTNDAGLLYGVSNYTDIISGLSYDSRTRYQYIFFDNPQEGALAFLSNTRESSVSVYKIVFTLSDGRITSGVATFVKSFAPDKRNNNGPSTHYCKINDHKILCFGSDTYENNVRCTMLSFNNDWTSFTTDYADMTDNSFRYRSVVNYIVTDSNIIVCCYGNNGDGELGTLVGNLSYSNTLTTTYTKYITSSYVSVFQADDSYFWLNVPTQGKQKLPIANFVISDTFSDTEYINVGQINGAGWYVVSGKSSNIKGNNCYYTSRKGDGSGYIKSSANALIGKDFTISSSLAVSGEPIFVLGEFPALFQGGKISSTNGLHCVPLAFTKNENVTTLYGNVINNREVDSFVFTKNNGAALSSDGRFVYYFYGNRALTINASPTITAIQTPFTVGISMENGSSTVKCVSGWGV